LNTSAAATRRLGLRYQVLGLITQVVERQEERSRTRRANYHD
jgi:hypothetical protein